jgi:hypothetical protein
VSDRFKLFCELGWESQDLNVPSSDVGIGTQIIKLTTAAMQVSYQAKLPAAPVVHPKDLENTFVRVATRRCRRGKLLQGSPESQEHE